jgi:hypothetical protein
MKTGTYEKLSETKTLISNLGLKLCNKRSMQMGKSSRKKNEKQASSS